MKSKDKNKGCFNCLFSSTHVAGKIVCLNAKTTRISMKIEHWISHKLDYSCKKWKPEHIDKS